jgi:alpha-L-fucosidase
MVLRPTSQQLRWQELEYGMFCHFGINTFYGKEWSDGTLDPAAFHPRLFDPAQWVAAAQAAGMRYLILTAKHHDGFCLWPTETTDYSVRSSPWQGDIVGATAEACRAAGMPFGLYLSPWDRHEPSYSDPPAYDRFYVRQLTELCTRYGPLFELWFDGAGSTGRVYDWDAIMAVARQHQPDAMIFNMGDPTIRWVGNEDGLADDPCYYAVDSTGVSAFTSAEAQFTAGARYCPPECDVAIRTHWFWQPDNLQLLKSLEHLLGIYYRSVGLGANLLLNVAPNRDGLLDTEDQARLTELADELRGRFARPLPARITQSGNEIELAFAEPVTIDHLVLREELRNGQFVDGYRVLDEHDNLVAEGHTIGQKKIHVFPVREVRRLRLALKTPEARLSEAVGYRTGHEQMPLLGGKVDYAMLHQKMD